jgi:hypothetical protein
MPELSRKELIRLQLKYSPVTRWWLKHPNFSWAECDPCDAAFVQCELGWKISLGRPDEDRLKAFEKFGGR